MNKHCEINTAFTWLLATGYYYIMPIYEYEHKGKACSQGKVFEWEQAISEEPLTTCPGCGRPVKRLISRTYLNITPTNAELKEKGFTKLVKRDKGVYENVTAGDKKGRVLNLGDATGPGFKSGRGD